MFIIVGIVIIIVTVLVLVVVIMVVVLTTMAVVGASAEHCARKRKFKFLLFVGPLADGPRWRAGTDHVRPISELRFWTSEGLTQA